MKIQIGKYYYNDDDIEDPYLVDNINDATEKNKNEIDEFINYLKDYEVVVLFVLSTKKWYNVYLKDIKII